MKSVEIEGFTRHEHPFVMATFLCRKLNLFGIDIDFLIDTGATCTTILEEDAKKLGIDFRKLEKSKYPSQILGGTMVPYVLPKSLLVFEARKKDKDKKRKLHTEYLDEIEVVEPKGSSDEPDFSILGIDIISRFDFIWEKNGKPIFSKQK